MKLLSLETSTSNLSLAVSCDEKIIRYRNYPVGRVLSSAIIPSIKNILKISDIALKEIDGFAVSLGPGSFTGLRVGLSTVKALAYSLKKPIVGVSTLDILALGIKEEKVQVCSVCDAKRKLVFGCVYEKDGYFLKRKTKHMLLAIEDLLLKIKKPVVFVGDGIPLFKEIIEKSGKVLRFEAEEYFKPQAKNMIPLVLDRFRQKDFENIDKLVPLYLHPHDCQVRKKKK